MGIFMESRGEREYRRGMFMERKRERRGRRKEEGEDELGMVSRAGWNDEVFRDKKVVG